MRLNSNASVAAESIESVATIASQFFPVLRGDVPEDEYFDGENVRGYYARLGRVDHPVVSTASGTDGTVGDSSRPMTGSASDTYSDMQQRMEALGTYIERLRGEERFESADELVAQGRAHFADHCAVCHGNDGAGDTSFGRGLYPPPPDMREVSTQELSDGELFWIIRNGIRFTGMPAFGSAPAEEDEETWPLGPCLSYISSSLIGITGKGNYTIIRPKNIEYKRNEVGRV